eukprot:m.14274 g.14274  ORF g.14274 m.14274 type:complete len:72 (-) comp5051_c0_seq1:1-216(-)
MTGKTLPNDILSHFFSRSTHGCGIDIFTNFNISMGCKRSQCEYKYKTTSIIKPTKLTTTTRTTNNTTRVMA